MEQITRKGETYMLRFTSLVAVILGIILVILPQALFAHAGGTPRLTNAEAGPYRIYAWTDPEPWRVGEVHTSLAVTKVNTDGSANSPLEVPVTDAEVTVTFTPAAGGTPITVQATSQASLADYYFEAVAQLPSDGQWNVTIGIEGEEGPGQTSFSLDVLPARSTNWLIIGGAGVGLIALVGVWAYLQSPATPAQRPSPHRGIRKQANSGASRAVRHRR
jgi:hypothetical protein